MRPYQPLLPRPSPEPEDVNTFRTRPFHMIDTPGGNGNQYGDFDPNMNMDMNQWPAGMFRSSQGLDAPNAFNATQALDTSQSMSEPRSFDAINGFSTSHDPQSFSAPHLDLNTSQAMNGSWGGFVPDNQQFQDPFAMPYGLNGRTFNLPMRTNSSEEHEVPSPMSGTPQRRHFSMNAIRSNLPANPSFDNNVRPSIEQDGRLQQHPNNTGFGQPEQLHRVSEENNNGSHQHFQSSQHNRVAIPQLNSQQPLPTQPASIAPSMGPLSSAVIVPARPKPGRKPLPQEDAQDRRRVQNRLAQRNFRDKRAQKVSELTVDNDRLRKEKEDAIKKYSNLLNDARQETKNLKRKYEAMEKDLEAANKRAQEAENKLHSHGSFKRFKDAGFPNPVLQATTTSASLPSITTNWRGPVSDYAANNSMMTPPEEGWPETDMSSFWTSRNPRRQSNANEDNGTQWLGSGMDVDSHEDDGCGFCTDESNCSCLQSKAAEAAKAISKPEIMPGGCDACQKDPQRAEACRALAAKTDRSPLPPSAEQRNDSMAAPPAPSASTGMVSCSKFIDRVNNQGFGQRVPSISELFGGIASHSIHSYPSSAGAAGYDVNEQEAAQVLQDMSRRPSKHMPSTPSS